MIPCPHRLNSLTTLALFSLILSSLARGQAAATTQPIAASHVSIPSRKSPPMMMPDISLDGRSIEQAFAAISQATPAFHVLVERSPESNQWPTLAAMSVKGLSVDQFLTFLNWTYPGVSYQRVDGPEESLYIVSVHANADQMNPQQVTDTRGESGSTTKPAFEPMQVHVYRLNAIVDHLALSEPAGSKRIEKAMDDLLSLLTAALSLANSTEQAVLQVHPGTRILLFKGTATQRAVVDQALETLQPPPYGQPDEVAAVVKENAQLQEKNETLEQQLSSLKLQVGKSGHNTGAATRP